MPDGMRIKPALHMLGDVWPVAPDECSKPGCSTQLRGSFLDHPEGAFCSLECAEGAYVTYRQSLGPDPLEALRRALGGAS